MDVSPSSRTVLYVITKATWGGAQRYVLDLIQEARGRGYEPVLAYGQPGLLVERVEALGVSTRQIPALARDISLAQDFRAYGQLKQLFVELRPDVVHLNSSKASAIGALAARAVRIPRIVFTAHGWAFNESRSFLSRTAFKLIQYVTVLASSRTITVSKTLATQVRAWPFVQKKIRTVYLGIKEQAMLDRDAARGALIARDATLASARDACWVGTIAELHMNKGIDIGIAAWKEADPRMEWIVLGGGEEEQKLRVQLPANIHLLGFVPDAARYLSAFDLFLLPSRTEALGYVLLEAGSAGIPILANRVGGIPEIIDSESVGTLFSRGDAHELAKELKAFETNPGPFRETGVTLQKRVRETFSIVRMLDETFAAYR